MQVEYLRDIVPGFNLHASIDAKRLLQQDQPHLTKVLRPYNRPTEEINWDQYVKEGCVVVEGENETSSQYHFYMVSG